MIIISFMVCKCSSFHPFCHFRFFLQCDGSNLVIILHLFLCRKQIFPSCLQEQNEVNGINNKLIWKLKSFPLLWHVSFKFPFVYVHLAEFYFVTLKTNQNKQVSIKLSNFQRPGIWEIWGASIAARSQSPRCLLPFEFKVDNLFSMIVVPEWALYSLMIIRLGDVTDVCWSYLERSWSWEVDCQHGLQYNYPSMPG